ncbi:hypothetical protein FC093_21630 [Ilyomonas limi]|uniref:DNA mismatch repair protein MutS-like N-terminal domain-containing protein n=1 Tax=Ilyomonas limi TaxID=2575867 RepID=A0A4U3KV10_9BACT|nr:hypothetical protein [Ilyomonas limi]TKK64857.1 hypothetical protein FC093_21630 [Ilyomonas limi]
MNTNNSIKTEEKALQPTFQVWQHMKVKFPDVIVLVRKDDHYYTFGNDAEIVSTLMKIKIAENSTAKPYCNVPYYNTDKLLRDIIKGGCRIALCDPLSAFKK